MCFHCYKFEVVSWLRISLSKYGSVGINVQERLLGYLANLVGCEVLHYLLSYLGVPLGGNSGVECLNPSGIVLQKHL